MQSYCIIGPDGPGGGGGGVVESCGVLPSVMAGPGAHQSSNPILR